MFNVIKSIRDFNCFLFCFSIIRDMNNDLSCVHVDIQCAFFNIFSLFICNFHWDWAILMKLKTQFNTRNNYFMNAKLSSFLRCEVGEFSGK